MTTADYLLGNDWHLARQRLDLLEAVFDPDTLEHMDALGMQPDWWCLDVGAGGGSIAKWLCARRGANGRVVTTDIDTRLLDALGCPQLEILRHDIVTQGFPQAEFHLVHTRAVLCHLADRNRALDHLVDALRPGAWALIEEPDYITEAIIPNGDSAAEATFRKVTDAKDRFVASHGFDRLYGRRVSGALRARGFTEIATEGRVAITPGSSPAALFFRLSTQQMRDRLVADGCVSGQDVDAYCSLLADPSHEFMWPTMLATRGRKPQP
jgi:SAM-dependent methyltransferase